MFEQKRCARQCQMLRTKPATKLHDKAMGAEKCRFRMLDAVGHFNAGRKRWRQFQPVKQLWRRAESAVQRIEQVLSTTSL